jgi:predicted transcriptional regulator
MPEKQEQKLRDLAEKTGIKFSELIRQAIYQFLKRENKP